ncbi:unnamed protein product [Adineta steineri]|uniref:Kelch domain-containing protein 10 n=1 Tax=Adineta steineri TaxID=433720 RepID=A0A815RW29_9BILA|nr:unnamed protein product [Adineta steineri]CAF3567292.1 unnamed protein product [Adineta steineri]
MQQRDESDSPLMDDTTTNKRTKLCAYVLPNYTSSINLMQFVEVEPLNSLIKPSPRSGHRAIATESDFWIWGGYHPSIDNEEPSMFNQLWRFNFALQRWTLETTTVNGPDLTVASHAMCVYRNIALVFGGTGYPFGHNVSRDLYMLDLKLRRWKQCTLLDQKPEPVYGASMIIKGDYLYVLCGTNAWRYNSDVYEIHLPTMKCKKIGNTFDESEEFFDGNGRYRQEAYLYEDKIFLFGGGSSVATPFSLEDLPMFDLTTHTWSFIHTNPDPFHNFPTARKFHSIFPFRDNQIIMFGGANYDHNMHRHGPVSGNLWIFDFSKLEWSMLPSLSMVKPTYFHAAAMNKRGEIWSHGGVVHEPTSDDDGERITTLYKMHSRVLKLSEVCWNHFLNCLSDRTCLVTQPKLMSQLNIPMQFIDRVH